MTFRSASVTAFAVMLVSAMHSIGAARQTPASGTVTQPAPAVGDTYVGSAACRRCHTATYERWSKTLMANVVTDPKLAAGRGPARLLETGSAADLHA